MATIDNKVTFEEFRKRCEDKSTITTKGQLYVGTSDHDTVNGKQITRTVATPEPIEYALLVRDDTQAGGLNWKSVADVLSAAKNDGHQSTSVESADNAKTAGVASNVESQINGHNITTIFESDGITAKEATNVSQAINGKSISTIFESDGITAKNAARTDFTNSEWTLASLSTAYVGDSALNGHEYAYINSADFSTDAVYQIVVVFGVGSSYASALLYIDETFTFLPKNPGHTGFSAFVYNTPEGAPFFVTCEVSYSASTDQVWFTCKRIDATMDNNVVSLVTYQKLGIDNLKLRRIR